MSSQPKPSRQEFAQRVHRLLKTKHSLVHSRTTGLIVVVEGDLAAKETRIGCVTRARQVIDDNLDLIVHPDYFSQGAIEKLIESSSPDTKVYSYTGLEDRLWNSRELAEWIIAHRDTGDYAFPRSLSSIGQSTADVYVSPALISVSDDLDMSVSVRRWCRGEAIEALDGRLTLISSDAGVGKSELTKTLEARSARAHSNHYLTGAPGKSPPLCIRVPLRHIEELSIENIVGYVASVTKRYITPLLMDHLLQTGRVTLLLDGLDELAISGDLIEDGLLQMADLAKSGTRILVTTRTGLTTRSGIPLFLKAAASGGDLPESIGLRLEEFDEIRGRELLGNLGLDERAVSNVLGRLPSELSGIPLFLIWSTATSSSVDQGLRRPASLVSLIHGICDREAEQEGSNTTDDQLSALLEIAEMARVGRLVEDDLRLAIGQPEGYSQFADGPHALLRKESDATFAFMHEAFRIVLEARAVSERWRAKEDTDLRDSLMRDVGVQHRFSELFIEGCAAFLSEGDVCRAWAALRQSNTQSRWARGLVLRVALRRVDDQMKNLSGDDVIDLRRGNGPARRRADWLAQELGGRTIERAYLDRITFSYLDFSDWTLRELESIGSEFHYCYFKGASLDGSLAGADFESCNGLAARTARTSKVGRADDLRQINDVFKSWRTGKHLAGFNGRPPLQDVEIPTSLLDWLEDRQVVRPLVDSDRTVRIELRPKWRSVARAACQGNFALVEDDTYRILAEMLERMRQSA